MLSTIVPSAVVWIGAYLLGSISFSYVIARRYLDKDIRRIGSGNAGATNVLRMAGVTAGLSTLVLDLAKGAVPVWIALALDLPTAVAAGTGVAAVLGHIFPIFLRFRGGKGVATGAGAMLPHLPLATGLALVVFLLLVVATRYVAIGSVVASLSLVPLALLVHRWGWAPQPPGPVLVAAAGIGLLILLKHLDNLQRLRAGTEARLGEGPPEGEEGP